MAQLARRKRPSEEGFSLFELLIVICIIAMMSLAALPSLSTTMETTRAQRSVGELRSLSLAQRLYRLETGQFADQLQQLRDANLLPSGAQGKTEGYEFHIREDALERWRIVARRSESSSWSGEFSIDQLGRLRGTVKGPKNAKLTP